ncbi:helix-turn-helix domain-containing protein [bacterium]|nr:helix-turn-helix domain-containing protein [bacterium]
MTPKEFEGLKLFSLREISEQLDISERTLRKHIQTGELKARRLGRKYFCTENAIKEFLENRK